MDELKKYSPQYQHINDTLAFVVHLSFLSQNCKLIGLNEEQYLDDLGSIPQGWNKSNEIYQFRYIRKSKQQQNKNKDDEQKNDDKNNNKNTILVKILSMQENELLVTAVKQGSNDVFTLEINLNDHIDTIKASKNLNDYQSVYRDINGLKVLLNDQITHKLIVQKKKDNKKEKDKNKNKNKKQDNNDNPLIFPDQNPNPNPLFIGGGRPGGGIPFGGGFGGGDMDPFGGNGGNLMGPNQINQQWRNKNNPNNNKPPFVPPNARFDPFGPGKDFPPGPDPNHFKPPGRGPGGGGGGGLGGFGGII